MKYTLMFFLVLLCNSFVLSQNSEDLLTPINIIPPSPNASSILKFVDMPVSHFTGTPDISIPLFTISTPLLNLPISIKYHAAGVKPEEYASWVGMGWSLDAGGVIGRSVRGLPDELNISGHRYGYYHNNAINAAGNIDWDTVQNCVIDPQNIVLTQTEDNPVNNVDWIALGKWDTEPDQYTVSAPGMSMKFFINKQGEIVKVVSGDSEFVQHPFQNPTSVVTPSDNEWILRGEDGTRYHFKSWERTTSYSVCGNSFSPYSDPLSAYESSWYLDKMIAGDTIAGDTIEFQYEQEMITYDVRHSESGKFRKSGTEGSQQVFSNCRNYMTVFSKRLKKIFSNNGFEVTFIADTSSRGDLNGSKKLTRIEIKKDGFFVKAFDFDSDETKGKLMLNAVQQVDENDNSIHNGFGFSYYPGNLPAASTKSLDIWGYYNGAGNTSLIPSYKDDFIHINPTSTSNREPDIDFTVIGNLKRVTYPTGGYAIYTYELNDYHDPNRADTYIEEVSAINSENVEGGVTVTEIFTVPTACSVSVFKDSEPNGVGSETKIEKYNGSSYQPITFTANGNRGSMPAGQYRITASSNDLTEKRIKVEYEQVDPGAVQGGGLRIKEIILSDPTNGVELKKVFSYQFEANSNSSGVLYRKPTLWYESSVIPGELGGMQSLACFSDLPIEYYNLGTTSMAPLTFYSGSPIGYSEVTETQVDGSDNENGKIVYTFINEIDQISQSLGYPFIPHEDLSDRNGKPISVRKFKKEGTVFTELEKTEYFYSSSIDTTFIYGLNLKYIVDKFCYECNSSFLSYYAYKIQPKWYYLVSDSTTIFTPNTELVSKNTYGYNSLLHHQPVSKTLTSSDGELREDLYIRAEGKPALLTEIISKRDGTQIAGAQIDYKSGSKLIEKQWVYNPDITAYEQVKEYKYNTTNNVIEDINWEDGVQSNLRNSYIWGYKNTYPIAVVVNASRDDIAYTSFESEGKGGWEYASIPLTDVTSPTGKKKYFLNGSSTEITKSGLSTSKKYVVSYWKKSGMVNVNGITPETGVTKNGWTYYEHTVDNPTSGLITISGTSGVIDELRLYPKGAQMSTYTYRPGYGLTSMTDPNNVTTHYNYDTFGQLESIQDVDRNMVKTFKYHYKQ